jgi:hypothetical protein
MRWVHLSGFGTLLASQAPQKYIPPILGKKMEEAGGSWGGGGDRWGGGGVRGVHMNTHHHRRQPTLHEDEDEWLKRRGLEGGGDEDADEDEDEDEDKWVTKTVDRVERREGERMQRHAYAHR